eukprot:scaffold1328_cov394-Prasinococcus_capsulatus_cf.AAC.37
MGKGSTSNAAVTDSWSEDAKKALEHIQRNIVGANTTLQTPFGARKLIYAGPLAETVQPVSARAPVPGLTRSLHQRAPHVCEHTHAPVCDGRAHDHDPVRSVNAAYTHGTAPRDTTEVAVSSYQGGCSTEDPGGGGRPPERALRPVRGHRSDRLHREAHPGAGAQVPHGDQDGPWACLRYALRGGGEGMGPAAATALRVGGRK